jgi:hypothetical protein
MLGLVTEMDGWVGVDWSSWRLNLLFVRDCFAMLHTFKLYRHSSTYVGGNEQNMCLFPSIAGQDSVFLSKQRVAFLETSSRFVSFRLRYLSYVCQRRLNVSASASATRMLIGMTFHICPSILLLTTYSRLSFISSLLFFTAVPLPRSFQFQVSYNTLLFDNGLRTFPPPPQNPRQRE